MGYPGKNRKKYETPRHPWQAQRMAEEVEYVKTYGLRNKRELWRAYSELRRYRREARRLLAEMAASGGEASGQVQKDTDAVLNHLRRLGVINQESTLDDVLALTVEDLLERRLQTQVFRMGLANTIKQARQFITHGHIAIHGHKITVPGFIVYKGSEQGINYYEGSALNHELHPERPHKAIQEGE